MSTIPPSPTPPRSGQPCKLAVTAAHEAVSNLPVGFDPTILIGIFSALFPILAQLMSGCTKPQPAPADYREFVTKRYRRGHYGPAITRRATRATIEQAAKAGNPMNDADAETATTALLDSIRNGTDEDIHEAMQAAG
jgi:hypothetical protein